ncbi:MAG: MBL fold metallo-hydrolase [Desulfobacterales bacterium]|jgi:glyoxylase-like metal-dependent hydrolase (beta-lactamase superfamily II)|nr:MBL fold metallo-hydrolase [Desulfobacteraceae bacterium]MBT4365647.1 MBL fold metallo-hydrolase [Desulfobacteraceae bacterium]MBT7086054.1 MBL fold metallo-hydrolase [Desulfobacterales bacterium]MBT7697319.1 MBL fold metallo-hydrolase [Desulfobacterales bacterium]
MKEVGKFNFSQEVHPDIFRITLPLYGEKPGPVNSYLFIGDTITLLDVGSAFSTKQLKRALSEHNIKFSDIDQIILSHGHPDHYGAARKIVKKSSGNTDIAIHYDDVIWITIGSDVPAKQYAEFYKLTAIPFSLRLLMRIIDKIYAIIVRPLKADLILNDGDEIILGKYQGKVISTPGHSKGSICIHIKEDNILFSGDTILGHITPNPFVMLEERKESPMRSSQKEYYDSLLKIEALSPDVVYPAHGKRITDLKTLLENYRETYSKRQARILKLISGKEQNIYQIAQKLFPKIKGIIKMLIEVYPMMSEVYTHIQVLQAENKVDSTINRGVMKVVAR